MTGKATEQVVANRLVWVRDVPHEAGTRFSVVEAPEKPTEVTPVQALRWREEDWLMKELPTAKPASAAAGEGA